MKFWDAVDKVLSKLEGREPEFLSFPFVVSWLIN